MLKCLNHNNGIYPQPMMRIRCVKVMTCIRSDHIRVEDQVKLKRTWFSIIVCLVVQRVLQEITNMKEHYQRGSLDVKTTLST